MHSASSCCNTCSNIHLSSLLVWSVCMRSVVFVQCSRGNQSRSNCSQANSEFKSTTFKQQEDTKCVQDLPESQNLFQPHSSPPPLQVLIPSVKLDYSHVQSRCGSLDRRGYSAGGGNVSLVLQAHCLSVIVSVVYLFCVFFQCPSFCTVMCTVNCLVTHSVTQWRGCSSPRCVHQHLIVL